MPRPPNPNRDEIVRRYQAGTDGPTLARQFGLHVTSVYLILHRAGVAVKRRHTFPRGVAHPNHRTGRHEAVSRPEGTIFDCWSEPTDDDE